jgi:hypothetical protein
MQMQASDQSSIRTSPARRKYAGTRTPPAPRPGRRAPDSPPATRERPRVGFQLSPTRDFSQTSCQNHLLAHASRAGCISGVPDDQAPLIGGTLLVRVPGTAPAPAREEAMAQAIQRTRPIFRTWSMRAARPDLQRVRFARSTGGPPAAQRFDPRLRALAPENALCSPTRERNDTFA